MLTRSRREEQRVLAAADVLLKVLIQSRA